VLRTGIDKKYAFVLLAVATLLLVVGIRFRPGQLPTEEAPSPVELQRLQSLVAERRLGDLSSYLSRAAAKAASGLVSILPGPGTGLVWPSPLAAIVPRSVIDTEESATILANDGSRYVVEPAADDGLSPFVFLSVPGAFPFGAARPAILQPRLGIWVLAVARNASNQPIFAHGIYQGTAPARCGDFFYLSVDSSVPISPSLIGGGLFSLDGALLGFIADCNRTPIVIAVSSIEEVSRGPSPSVGQIERAYGMVLSFSTKRPTVVGLWQGSIASRADLHTGDVIQAVDGQQVTTQADLRPLADRKVQHLIVVQRGSELVEIPLEPSEEAPAEAIEELGLVLGTGSRQVKVVEVTKDGRAAAVGVLAGDTLAQINSTSVRDLESAIRALTAVGNSSVRLTLERAEKRLQVMILENK
jgi:S1-C subfamily serine protease